MTTENINRIELKDIVRISFECKACGSSVALKPETWRTGGLKSCPACDARWMFDGKPMQRTVETLLSSFRAALEISDDLPFTLRFEVPVAK